MEAVGRIPSPGPVAAGSWPRRASSKPMESGYPLLKKSRKSDFAGTRGDCILSDTEEERDIPEDLKQDALPQLPEADREAACNKPTQEKRRSKKLTLITDGQKSHPEEKPYKCTECGMCFKGHSSLLSHLQTHTRKKVFECVACGKSFTRKANLVLHQRIHTKERPYKCKECEKTFSSTSNLISHSKSHVKKKAFSCSTCGKSLSGRAALFQHQRDHVDEKPYKCTECGTSFSLYSNFTKHQWIHLREEPSEHTADADPSELTSLDDKEDEVCGAENPEMDHFSLVFEELKKMRENVDLLLLNQQSQLQVLQEIQKQLNILLPVNDLINSNIYGLGLLLLRQAAAGAPLSLPLLNPSSFPRENVSLLSQLPALGVLTTTHLPVSQ